jgi:LmbE family N-acetylglucosaminyl deacetylase
MAVVYVLAHFDDEYGAWPMIRRGVEAGLDQRFLYVADYASAAAAAARFAEARAALAALGVDPACAQHVGRGLGAMDGAVHLALEAAADGVRAAVRAIGPVERLVAPAWEGGHADHDAVAFLAAQLAPEFADPPIDQFSLYQGRGLPWRLFRACAPIPENGAVVRIPLTAAEWAAYARAVKHYPSQWKSWLGLWPGMLATFAARGFAYQRLDRARVGERPHAGPLLYERMFATPYAAVRAALDAAAPRLRRPAA